MNRRTGSQPQLPIFPIFLRPRKRHPPGAKAHSVAFPLCHGAQDFFHPGNIKAKDLISCHRSLFVDPSTFGQFLIEILEKSVVEWNKLGRKPLKWWWRIQIKTVLTYKPTLLLLESILSSKPADGRDSARTFFVWHLWKEIRNFFCLLPNSQGSVQNGYLQE